MSNACDDGGLQARYDSEQNVYYYYDLEVNNNDDDAIIDLRATDNYVDDNDICRDAANTTTTTTPNVASYENNEMNTNQNGLIDSYLSSMHADHNNHVFKQRQYSSGITKKEIKINVYSATTTMGGNIVSDTIDSTGIMIWPATHLMCQYITMSSSISFLQQMKNLLGTIMTSSNQSNSNNSNHNNDCVIQNVDGIHRRINQQGQQHEQGAFSILKSPFIFHAPTFATTSAPLPTISSMDRTNENKEATETPRIATTAILELGCGCGLVGVAAASIHNLLMTTQQQRELQPKGSRKEQKQPENQPIQNRYLYVSTDMNETALRMCQRNYISNNIIPLSYSNSLENNDKKLQQQHQQQRHMNDDYNCISNNESETTSSSFGFDVWIRSLTWGDIDQMNNIQSQINQWRSSNNIDKSKNTNNYDFYENVDAKKFTSINTINQTEINNFGGTNSNGIVANNNLDVDDRMHENNYCFDVVLGADIVYPSTCGETLDKLFQTVDQLLIRTSTTTTTYSNNCNDSIRHHENSENSDNKEVENDNDLHDDCDDNENRNVGSGVNGGFGGIFYLSFCTRDGCKTPRRLLEAASTAGFAIIASITLPSSATNKNDDDADDSKQYFNFHSLPPLLDSKILILQRHHDAMRVNDKIGMDDNCPIFPGLRAAMIQLQLLQEQQKEINENSDYYENEALPSLNFFDDD